MEMEECKMREEIKNSSRRTIGYIEKLSGGRTEVREKNFNKLGEIREEGEKLVAYDRHFSRMGYWQKRDDTTYDRTHRKIGKGNLLIDLYFNNN